MHSVSVEGLRGRNILGSVTVDVVLLTFRFIPYKYVNCVISKVKQSIARHTGGPEWEGFRGSGRGLEGVGGV